MTAHDADNPHETTQPDETRRRLVRTILAAPIALAVPAVLGNLAFGPRDASAALLTPTPACDDDDDDHPTPRQTEGPYFTPDSPLRASLLEPGLAGTRLVVTGMVLRPDCRPVAHALVDFWQCDDAGNYDNSGYRLRPRWHLRSSTAPAHDRRDEWPAWEVQFRSGVT